MAKFSKYFLEIFLFGFCKSSEVYETVFCNNDQNIISFHWDEQIKWLFLKTWTDFSNRERPFRILFPAGRWPVDFISMAKGFWANWWILSKIVGEADLDVGFDDDNDRKFYTLIGSMMTDFGYANDVIEKVPYTMILSPLFQNCHHWEVTNNTVR